MAKTPDRKIADLIELKGKQSFVGYAIRYNGRLEARKFLEGLNKDLLAYFIRLFERKADGEIFNKDRFEKIKGSDGIFEFKHKRSGCRIFCFLHSVKYRYKNKVKTIGIWWLTHGFFKKTQKTPKSQIRRAEQIKTEHIEFLRKAKRR